MSEIPDGLIIAGTMLLGKDTKNPEWSFLRIDANGQTYRVLAHKDKLNGQVAGDSILAVVNAMIEEYKGKYSISYMLDSLQ